MNRLSSERSAYLKHAADQKIDWYPWSEKAFKKAESEDKPLFLSSGAVWCHWCHVMAEECFFDDDIADILNKNFIAIKLDRDERPDIDRRYQMAVAAMGSGGGWPLSVFLTPDRKPFFGGTYFPPEDRFGKPGFKKVLKAIIDLYGSKRGEISEYSERLMHSLKVAPIEAGDISESMLDKAVESILSEYDPQNGGFGSSPKFPMPGAMEFLIGRYSHTRNETIGLAVSKTLEAMARGGFYDQIRGGFHRYSTDSEWIIPHFEKMADDNAWLLRNYLSAYAVFGDDLFKDIAEETVNFIRAVLSDPDGGFYASQDADVTPGDEGGYFTWKDEDLRKVLDEDEYRILSLHLMDKAGAMHHDASKKVLYAVMSADEVAGKTGKDLQEVTETIKRGKLKLLDERNKRQAPFVDKTLYASVNGMLISVCLLYSRTFRDEDLKDFALHSLEKILKIRLVNDQLYHTEGVKALLDDYACVVEALTSAYEATGDKAFLLQAEKLSGMCMDKLWDKEEGVFFDTEDHVLDIKIKGIEDIPHPSANALFIMLMLKLHSITGKDDYLQHAQKTLKAFSTRAQNMVIHGGYYFYALDMFYNPLKLTLFAKPSAELSGTARSITGPHTIIVHAEDKGMVVPCIKDVCYEPVSDPEKLKDFFKSREYLMGITK